jgi:hypothetical protein
MLTGTGLPSLGRRMATVSNSFPPPLQARTQSHPPFGWSDGQRGPPGGPIGDRTAGPSACLDV